jgi:hypothetical protein
MRNALIDDHPIEILSIEDLRTAVRRVEATEEPVVVSLDGDQVMLGPVTAWRDRRTREQRAEDDAAFLAAAGGWKGLIDPEEFKKQIREGRSSDRPAVDLTRREE